MKWVSEANEWNERTRGATLWVELVKSYLTRGAILWDELEIKVSEGDGNIYYTTFKPFWRGVHVRERRYKKTNDKVSLTLRDCLGLSIQGRNSINFNFQSIFNSINFKDLTAQYLDQATIRE